MVPAKNHIVFRQPYFVPGITHSAFLTARVAIFGRRHLTVYTLCDLFNERCYVEDQGCLSRILYPDFLPSRIPNPGSRIQQEQKEG